MSDWWGDDGQKYDSWDKWRAANNRYRQQEEQTKAINKLLEYKEEEKRKQELQEYSQKIKEKQEEIQNNISEFKYLFNNNLYLEKINYFNDIELTIRNLLGEIEKNLKLNIDSMVSNKSEYLKLEEKCKKYKKNDTSFLAIYDKHDRNSYCIEYQDEEYIFVEKIVFFKNFNIQRKISNINFCDNLYENTYNNIIMYLKAKFKELNLEFDLDIHQDSGFILLNKNIQRKLITSRNDLIDDAISNNNINNSILERADSDKKTILENLKLENEKITELKRLKEIQKNENNEKVIDVNNQIKEINDRITKLKDIIEIENIDKIKEKVIDIDYEFSKSIIGKMYPDNEIKLLLKTHIKDLEFNLDKIKNEIMFYKIRDYLLNNVTSINILDYKEFNSEIDYDEKYNNILNYENEQKELKKEIQKKKELEEQKKLVETLKAVERQKRLEEQKETVEKLEKIEQQKKQQKNVYEKNKKYYKQAKWSKILFFVFTIPMAIMLWVNINDFLLGIGFFILCILVGLIFCKIFNPKKHYLKDIKQFGFDNIEDFEKEVLNSKKQN